MCVVAEHVKNAEKLKRTGCPQQTAVVAGIAKRIENLEKNMFASFQVKMPEVMMKMMMTHSEIGMKKSQNIDMIVL